MFDESCSPLRWLTWCTLFGSLMENYWFMQQNTTGVITNLAFVLVTFCALQHVSSLFVSSFRSSLNNTEFTTKPSEFWPNSRWEFGMLADIFEKRNAKQNLNTHKNRQIGKWKITEKNFLSKCGSGLMHLRSVALLNETFMKTLRSRVPWCIWQAFAD